MTIGLLQVISERYKTSAPKENKTEAFLKIGYLMNQRDQITNHYSKWNISHI